MQKFHIMIIDDEYSLRQKMYEGFFVKEYQGLDISFTIDSIEYTSDILFKLSKYREIDAFFIDARLENDQKGWGDKGDCQNFNTILSQIEKTYSDLSAPPIFVLSKFWQEEGKLLTTINRAFSVFHNPLNASRYYNQEEIETAVRNATILDENASPNISTLREERTYIANEILKNRAMRYNSTSPVDVVLQVAVPDEKTRAYKVLELSEEDDEYLKEYGLTYQETTIGNHHIVVVPQSVMGMTDAARTATAAILAFKPRLIVMTGICAGNKDKTKLGELVVASQTFDYAAGKLQPDYWAHRPNPFKIDASLDAFVNTTWVNNSKHIYADIDDAFNGDALNPQKIHFTAMASGPWVVDNSSVFSEITKTIASDCYTLDMEAYGVATAANTLRVPWLIIKSVQDYADGKKNATETKSRAYAAFSSTFLLKKYLDKIMKFLK